MSNRYLVTFARGPQRFTVEYPSALARQLAIIGYASLTVIRQWEE